MILLSRNSRIRAVGTTFMAFVYFGPAAVVDIDWGEFRYLGSTTVGKRGIEVDVNANGSLAMSFCSLRDFDVHGLFIAAADADNFAIDNMTLWEVGASAGQAGILVSATTGTNWSLTNIDCIGAGSGAGISLFAYGGTLTNIRCNSTTDGLLLSVLGTAPESIHKTWSGFECHSNTASGISVGGLDFGKLSNVNLWRNFSTSTAGLYLDAVVGRLVIENGNFFGNAVFNVNMTSGTGPKGLVLRNVVLSGDTTFATVNGIAMGSTGANSVSLECDNCTFGVVSGIKVAHTNDINCSSTISRYAEITLRNTLLASAVEILDTIDLRGRSYIKYQRVDQVTNVHKTVYPRLGTVSYETGTFKTAAPSQALAPAGRGAGEKLESGPKRKRIANGATVAISVYVRKSAAYVGNAPRLMQRANPAIGVLTDTLIDTHSVAADVWEQLSGVTAAATETGQAEFYVDCDGAAGSVFVDDWS